MLRPERRGTEFGPVGSMKRMVSGAAVEVRSGQERSGSQAVHALRSNGANGMQAARCGVDPDTGSRRRRRTECGRYFLNASPYAECGCIHKSSEVQTLCFLSKHLNSPVSSRSHVSSRSLTVCASSAVSRFRIYRLSNSSRRSIFRISQCLWPLHTRMPMLWPKHLPASVPVSM